MDATPATGADLKAIERLNSHSYADGFPPGINFLNSVQATMRATDRSRSSVYELIAAGELEAVKDGKRLLITGKSIVERTRQLPRAQIGQTKPRAA